MLFQLQQAFGPQLSPRALLLEPARGAIPMIQAGTSGLPIAMIFMFFGSFTFKHRPPSVHSLLYRKNTQNEAPAVEFY